MKNGLTTSKMPKIWVGRTTLNEEKKKGGLSVMIKNINE